PRIHVRARADPRGRLRRTAPRAAASAPLAGARRPRDGDEARCSWVRGAALAPCRPRRAVGSRGRPLAPGGRENLRLWRARPGRAGPFFEAAIAAVDRLGAHGDRTLKLDSCIELCAVRVETGQFDASRALAATAEVLAVSLGDRPRLAKIRVGQAQLLWAVPD